VLRAPPTSQLAAAIAKLDAELTHSGGGSTAAQPQQRPASHSTGDSLRSSNARRSPIDAWGGSNNALLHQRTSSADHPSSSSFPRRERGAAHSQRARFVQQAAHRQAHVRNQRARVCEP